MRKKGLVSSGLSLMEILIAITLIGLVFLAVTSVDIASRRFFGTSKEESWIQDEAKIAMGHIASRLQRGVGDMTDPFNMGQNPIDISGNSSRGAYILGGAYVNPSNPGVLATSGSRIWIKVDEDSDGRYDPALDKVVEYEYSVGTKNITFYPDAELGHVNPEVLAEGIVESAIFSFDNVTPIPNQVDVQIRVLRDPTQPKSLDNPETTLDSSIILRAMSTN